MAFCLQQCTDAFMSCCMLIWLTVPFDVQALRAIIPTRDANEWEAICPAWAKLFRRLVLDNSRSGLSLQGLPCRGNERGVGGGGGGGRFAGEGDW